MASLLLGAEGGLELADTGADAVSVWSGVSPQELLPDEVVGARFYAPGEAERALAERLAEVRRLRGREP